MNTRMEKYHNGELARESRVDRNQKSYAEVSEEDIDSLNLSNNVSVLEADTTNVDVEKLRAILDKKYRKDKRSVFDDYYGDEPNEPLEDTKEYDLNKALNVAHSEKDNDYEKNRYKKLRNEEFEILKNLKIERSYEETEPTKKSIDGDDEASLVGLIETIKENELKRTEIKNELLRDLMGNENTEVLEPIKSELDDTDTTLEKPTILEELEKTKQLSKKDIDSAMAEAMEVEHETVPIENTFYTGKLSIDENDLEDFKDLQKEIKSNGILIRILIIMVVLVVLAVTIYILNKYLNLGLF